MAREIDWDQPISDEDRAWAAQRPDAPAGNGMTVQQRVELNDQEHGKAAKDAKKTRGERIADLQVVIADAQNEIERLHNEQAEEERRNVALGGDPTTGNQWADNTGVDGEKPEGAPDAPETYSDEKYWTVARLKQEIESRNPDREGAGLDPLSTNGKRAELVERLLKDDEDLANSGEEN